MMSCGAESNGADASHSDDLGESNSNDLGESNSNDLGKSNSNDLGESNDRESFWLESSTELILTSEFWQHSFGSSPDQSSYRCSRYPRSRMSDEQRMYLRTLKPATTELFGMCDASRTSRVMIVDENSSWKQFVTDDSTASCNKNEIALTVTSEIQKHFSEGGLPCIQCENSCANGVCAHSVCVNFDP
jgi:hypothetical protein